MAYEHADEWPEAHGEDGGERHREEDLADEPERDHDDGRGDDETDEAPGPHPDARDPADGRRDVVAVPTRRRRFRRAEHVVSELVREISGLGHVHFASSDSRIWLRSFGQVS